MSELATAADLNVLMERLMDNSRRDQCPPHLVHPRYLGPAWEMADMAQPIEDSDRVVGCANLCGATFWFRRVSRDAADRTEGAIG